jgi:hypothetical protein
MEVADFSKPAVPFYKTSRHHIPEGRSDNTYNLENVKPHVPIILWTICINFVYNIFDGAISSDSDTDRYAILRKDTTLYYQRYHGNKNHHTRDFVQHK